ncbi:MAG: alkaline phosphatase family protein [Planctomycetes bacterium]|nr:alkaline phosphatase family protein [Planctomycetota bacterium]
MKLAVLCCVGLTPAHLGADTPALRELAQRGFAAPLASALPAVTTTAQATMLTGELPSRHGIVANGWFFRELGEVWLWRQSERLIEAPLPWQRPGGPRTLKHFWWYAMQTRAAATVTPRPVYHHDGRKAPDFYAWPYELKQAIRERHGEFPLFRFWGPGADIAATRWIAESFRTAIERTDPELALCYLPHLDYDLQRFGPSGPHLARALRELDAVVGPLLAWLAERGYAVLVVSEYGIEPVSQAAFPNRALRQAGLLQAVRNAAGELLDTGASRAFAVCDHQIAHVYCADPAAEAAARAVLERLPGIERVYGGAERSELGLDHPRSGELIALAAPGWWFAYDYWLDDGARPDFARCVEIHKKPGYDPRELFLDPRGGRWRLARALLRKALGLRYVMDVCPLDSALVRGSHGRPAASPEAGPLLIASARRWQRASWHQRDVAGLIAEILAS